MDKNNQIEDEHVKLSWKEIYDEFSRTYPTLHKKMIMWEPYGYATIKVHTQGGVDIVYNYDEKRGYILPEPKIKITEEQARKIRERMGEADE